MALSRRRVRQLQARANRQARRTSTSSADVAAGRAALSSIKQQRRTDIRSVRGAEAAAQRTLRRAASQLPSSGLHGRYLRQTAQEFASRQSGLAGQLPSLVAATRQQYRPSITSARSDIASARAGLQSDIASNLHDLLQGVKSNQKDRSKNHRAAAKEHHKAVRGALAEANRLIRAGGHDKMLAWFAANPEKNWAQFEGDVGHAEGVTPVAAARAVAQIRKRLAAQARAYAQAGQGLVGQTFNAGG